MAFAETESISSDDLKDRLVRKGESVISLAERRVDHSTADECAEATAEALCHPDCKVIWIRFSNAGITDSGVASLGRAIPHSTTLKNLDVGHNDISAVGAREIAHAVSLSCSLVDISLEGNTLGPNGIKAFAEINPPLQWLNLQDTGIDDAGMPYFASLLRSTSTLKILHLEDNLISDTGPIADALSTNSTLQSLYLGSNIITDRGIRGLAKAIICNKHLRYLDLMYNDEISDIGGNALLTALPHNTIIDVFFSQHDTGSMSDEVAIEINEIDNWERRRPGMYQRVSVLLLTFADYPKTKFACKRLKSS